MLDLLINKLKNTYYRVLIQRPSFLFEFTASILFVSYDLAWLSMMFLDKQSINRKHTVGLRFIFYLNE